jgi:hypothetical protein
MPRKVLSRSQLLSQFFTVPEIAQECLNQLKQFFSLADWNHLIFVECAAGDGAFYHLLPPDRRRGVEVDPLLIAKYPEYIPCDAAVGGFLSVSPVQLRVCDVPRERVVVGFNPPFSIPKFGGRSHNVALEFMNHAAQFSDTLAMILPNTFRRPLTKQKVDSRFTLVFDVDIPRDAFRMDGAVAKVTTVYQIWKVVRDPTTGEIIPRERDPLLYSIKKGVWGGDWKYVKSTDTSANVRVCNWGSHVTVGRLTGPEEVKTLVARNQKRVADKLARGESIRAFEPDNSHYYLACDDPISVMTKFTQRKHLFEELAWDRTSGHNPDLTHGDVVHIYKCDPSTHYRQGKWISKPMNEVPSVALMDVDE